MIVTLIRDFLVTGYKTREQRGASKAGKIKAAFQMVGLSVALIDMNPFGKVLTGGLTGFSLYLNIISTTLISIAVIATIISGLDYLRESIRPQKKI